MLQCARPRDDVQRQAFAFLKWGVLHMQTEQWSQAENTLRRARRLQDLRTRKAVLVAARQDLSRADSSVMDRLRRSSDSLPETCWRAGGSTSPPTPSLTLPHRFNPCLLHPESTSDGALLLHELQVRDRTIPLTAHSGCITARGTPQDGEGMADMQYAFGLRGHRRPSPTCGPQPISRVLRS